MVIGGMMGWLLNGIGGGGGQLWGTTFNVLSDVKAMPWMAHRADHVSRKIIPHFTMSRPMTTWQSTDLSCSECELGFEYKDVLGVEGQELLSHHRALRLTSLTLGIGHNTEEWIERQYVSPGWVDITFRWVWMGVSPLSFHRMHLTNQWKIIFRPFNVERGLATSFCRSRVTNPDNNTIRLVSMSQP